MYNWPYRICYTYAVTLLYLIDAVTLLLSVSQVAKWVGDLFNHGLYDTHIQLKKTPFLEWESPRQLDKLVAEDVMNSSGSQLSYLYPITRVRSIEKLLRTTVHSAFPVVTPIDASTIPILPKNIKSQHTPQLYTRPSVINGRGVPSPVHSPLVRIRNPIPEEMEDGEMGDEVFRSPVALDEDEGGDRRGFVKTYTIPENLQDHGGEWVQGRQSIIHYIALLHMLRR